MPAITDSNGLLELIRKSGAVDAAIFNKELQRLQQAGPLPADARKLAAILIREGLLTEFQAGHLLQGKWKNLVLNNKYRLLGLIGSGGMGKVYLCEHVMLRRRVALKVLPTQLLEEPSSLERFLREARAAASLDHPNIIRAHDIDQSGQMYFLVMEFVEGINLQDMVRRGGPLEVNQAAHYIAQAACGLQHAYLAGWVHRDIKPSNLLVDRTGVVKILDMGLAKLHSDEKDDLTKRFDANKVLGTVDYISPEQATNSSQIDVRTDIYSLGGTFYFLLTGAPPFNEGSTAQKLLARQVKKPRPVHQLRPEVPEHLSAVIDKMLARDLNERYQSPDELLIDLHDWMQLPLFPPNPELLPPPLPPLISAPPTNKVATTSTMMPAVTLSTASGRLPAAAAGPLSSRILKPVSPNEATSAASERSGKTKSVAVDPSEEVDLLEDEPEKKSNLMSYVWIAVGALILLIGFALAYIIVFL